MFCKYCGKQMDDSAAFCSACGKAAYDSGAANVAGTRSPRKILLGIGACLCVGLLITGLIFTQKSAEARREEEESLAAAIAESESIAASIAESEAIAESLAKAEQLAQEEYRKQYLADLNSLAEIAEEGIDAAEAACSFYCLLWYNTLFEEYDEFTDPYTMTDGVFHSDPQDTFDAAAGSVELRSAIMAAEICNEEMMQLLNKIADPPSGLSKCYEAAENLLDAYMDIYVHAQGPYGSFSSYAENYNQYSTSLRENYRKFCALIPEN